MAIQDTAEMDMPREYNPHMEDIYRRLHSDLFLKRNYVLKNILPAWWRDDMASVPTKRQYAEMCISDVLDIPMEALASRETPLLVDTDRTRLKRIVGTTRGRIAPSIKIAEYVALIASWAIAEQPFETIEGLDPRCLHGQIRGFANGEKINVEVVVRFCWSIGLPVIWLENLPEGAARVHGFAVHVAEEDRPVIVLRSRDRSSPFVLWDLCHELGHIACGHHKTRVEIDVGYHKSKEELLANKFAELLIFGRSGPGLHNPKTKTDDLLRFVRKERHSYPAEPGVLATNFGHTMRAKGYDRWGLVRSAIKQLKKEGLAHNGADIVQSVMRECLDLSSISRDEKRSFIAFTGWKP